MTTIPASDLVNVSPSVENAGGTAVDIIGLCLTGNSRVPIGSVLSFPSAAAVSTYFGAAAKETQIAGGGSGLGGGYFAGFSGATKTPSNILFAQYNSGSVAAYVRGGSVAALSLAQLQAINGTLNVSVDGYPRAAAALNLSTATSFSNAASLIATALNAGGANPAVSSMTGSIAASTSSFTASISGKLMTVTNVTSGQVVAGTTLSGTGVTANTLVTGQVSGTPGGIGTYSVDTAQVAASTAVAGTYGTMTVSAVLSGALAVGQTLSGTGVTAGTQVTQLGTGTGGTGTYFVSSNAVVSSTTITGTGTNVAVSYDSTSGAFTIASGVLVGGAASTAAFATGTTAASLGLTSATGAVLSQGAAAAVPQAFMNALVSVNQNWATFFTSFDPDGGSGNSQKQAFAAWKTTKNNRFAYVCWDADVTPTQSVPASSSLGQILAANGDSGTYLQYEPTFLNHAAFISGAAASIDFSRKGGRISFAYRAQPGLVAGVTDETTATNLAGSPQSADRGNGYNFYGAYANANQGFVWEQRGFVTGPFMWFDTYINQIWMNSLFQSALLNMQGNVGSIPYTTAGYSLIEAALADPIQQALSFGAFGPDTLSASQISKVNNDAGQKISDVLQTQGYYLQIVAASPATRQARTSPQITFWYIDQGSIQSLDLSSVGLL
jgi:hypothetical protein